MDCTKFKIRSSFYFWILHQFVKFFYYYALKKCVSVLIDKSNFLTYCFLIIKIIGIDIANYILTREARSFDNALLHNGD